MLQSRGKVPRFSLMPHPMIIASFILVLVVGSLIGLALLSKDGGVGDYRHQADFVFLVTGILCILIFLMGTSKLWFRHLWKKNSTHARHKQHTKYHPTRRDQNKHSRW